MDTLRVGSKGSFVENWQFYLRGLNLFFGEIDGVFDDKTKAATQEFQRQQGLKDDGVAGNLTLGRAMTLGFHVINDNPDLPDTLDPPPKPKFAPLNLAGRQQAFGQFPFESAPVEGNPEAIRITSNWEAQNIVSVNIPQLIGVKGAPASGNVRFHRLVAPRVVGLFQAWEDAGLKGLILSWSGSFVPRFIRGSRSILSQHAFGSAFDINAEFNGFGRTPAALGTTGSVRALVPTANERGFYWGGHFAKRDGMHFEIATP